MPATSTLLAHLSGSYTMLVVDLLGKPLVAIIHQLGHLSGRRGPSRESIMGVT